MEGGSPHDFTRCGALDLWRRAGHRLGGAPVTHASLASHVVSRSNVDPDPAIRDAFTASSDAVADLQLLACVDPSGKIDRRVPLLVR